MPEEKTQGKWASEVYDTLRILRRINHTVYGLLLIEIGWILLLVLLLKLSPSGGTNPTPAVISVPWPDRIDIKVADLVIPGAIMIGLLWAVWSRLIEYALLIGRNVLRGTVTALAVPTGVLILLVGMLLLPVAYPLEYIWAKRWIRRLGDEGRQKHRRVLGDYAEKRLGELMAKGDQAAIQRDYGLRIGNLVSEGRQLDEQQKERLRNLLEEKELYRHAVEKTGLSCWGVLRLLVAARRWVATRICSRACIAFAPLRSFSYEEDLSAAKAPAQIFSAATNHLDWRLRDLNLLKHVRFRCLPEHIAPNTPSEAASLRRVLGLDVLLWGSYLPGSTTKMWLNIEQSLPRSTKNKKRDESRKPYEDLFPIVFRMRYSMMMIDQREPLHAYVLLFISLVQALQVRQDRHGGFGASLFSSCLWDELRFTGTESTELIEVLAFEMLPLATTMGPTDKDESRSPRRILAEVVGGWIGHKLAGSRYGTEASGDIERSMRSLSQVMKRCIQLEPRIPENYYRYGALLSMLGEHQEAISIFRQAKKWEDTRLADDWSLLLATAEIALDGVDSPSAKVPLAMCAADAARAINIGGDWTKKSLRKALDESKIYHFVQLSREIADEDQKGDPVQQADGPWSVIEHLLSDEYPPGLTV